MINESGGRESYSGNAATVAFSFPHKFLLNADIKVVLRDDVTGVETAQVLDTDYTLTGVGLDAGGTVTMAVAPALATTLTIYRDPSRLQPLLLKEYENLPAKELEKAFDRLTILAQTALDNLNRSVKLSDGHPDSFDTTLPNLLTAKSLLIVNDTGDGLDLGPDVDSIINALDVTAQAVVDAQAAATSAANSASSASIQSTNASTYATNAFNSAAAAANSASAAATSEGNAATSESNADAAKLAAQAAQAAAENAANSTIWSNVVFLTPASSPRTITDADKGTLFVVDCTSGNFNFVLDPIASLTLTNPWSVGIKKSDSSGNIISISCDAADLIDGSSSSMTVSVPSAGVTLVPDDTPSPDEWTAVLFGAGGGSSAPDLEGTIGSPATASSGIALNFSGTSYFNKKWLVSSGGAIALGATPQIQPGNLVGQQLLLTFCSDTDTVEMNDGNGLELAGKFIGTNKRKILLEWDGTIWSENWRR